MHESEETESTLTQVLRKPNMSSIAIVRSLIKTSRQLAFRQRFYAGALRCYAKEAAPEDAGPVKFSTSKAAKWKAIETRAGPEDTNNWPWYQTYVVSGCLSVFLLYFCVLREESDIDHELNTSLYDRIDGLEEKMLEQRIQYNEEHGIESTDLKDRLRVLQQESIRLRKM